MGSITINEVIAFTLKLSGFIGAIGVISAFISKILIRHIKKVLEPIYTKIENIEHVVNEKIDKLDEGQCKNYMSRYLKDCENGEKVDETETERFWEIYDHYTKPKDEGGLGLNSYFHKKVEKLQKEGKL